jgi:hypothetical protein
MVDVFTKAVVREIGRNVGKTASNALLGDSHSTPYRRVGGNNKVVLGASSGGKNYKNQLDRLIRTFQIKGKLATFNSAQNIYNEYFNLVKEANEDDNIDLHEATYLLKEYYRCIEILNRISVALIEMGDEGKAQLVNEKIINLNEFMVSLDDSFQVVKKEPEIKDKSFYSKSSTYYLLFVLNTIFLIIIAVSESLYLDPIPKLILLSLNLFFPILAFGLGRNEKLYRKKIEQQKKYVKLVEDLKEAISEAAHQSISIKEINRLS